MTLRTAYQLLERQRFLQLVRSTQYAIPSAVFVVALWFASVATGCAARGTIQDPTAPLPPEPITLEVHNHNWLDMAIYVVNGSQRFRVMTVVATNAGSVVLPRYLLGHGREIRLQADPVGESRRYTSERVFAYPGSTIMWTLETDLRKSNVAVW